jgi:hypothetical protein
MRIALPMKSGGIGSRPFGAEFAIGLGFVLIALLLGAIVALGSNFLNAAILGGVGGVMLLLLSTELLLYGMVIFVFVLVGLLTYFGGINQALWVPYGIGLLLYVKLLAAQLGRRPVGPTALLPIYVPLILFGLLIAISSVVNKINPLELLIAGKNYLFLWSIMIAVIAFLDCEKRFERIWLALIAIAAIQLPFAAYQYVVVGGKIASAGGMPWDAVVGTFGGKEMMGGQSATLGFFLVFSILAALAMVRAGRLSKRLGYAIAILSIATMTVAEVKVMVLVYLPIALALFYRRSLARNPVKYLFSAMAVAALALAIMAAYVTLHYDRGRPKADNSVMTTLSTVISRETDTRYSDQRQGMISKFGLIPYWWEKNGFDKPIETIIGHGVGASRVSSFFVGEAAADSEFRLDRHAASILLWDLGIAGLAAFSAILLIGSRISFSLAADRRIPEVSRAMLEVGGITVFMFFLSLLDNRFVIAFPTAQSLLMLLLGHAGYWWLRIHGRPSRPAGASGMSGVRVPPLFRLPARGRR